MTSRAHSWTAASAPSHTGFSPPFCSVCRVRRGIARELGVHGPDQLSLVLVAPEYGRLLRDRSPLDRHRGSGWALPPPGTRAKPDKVGPKLLGRRPRCRRKKCEPGRGHYAKDRPAIIAWVSRQGRSSSRRPKIHREDGAEGSRPCCPSGQSSLYRLGEQLSGGEGLHARVRQSYEERIRAWGGARESGRVPVLLTQTISARVSWPQQVNLPGYVGFFQFLRNVCQQNACEQAELILRAALDPVIASRARRGEFVRVLGPL